MKMDCKKLIKSLTVFIAAFLTISGIIGVRFVWHLLILISFFLLFLMIPKKRKITKISILLTLTFILFSFSIINSKDFSALFSNIRSSLYSLCIIGILYLINVYDNEYICKVIFKNIKLLNFVLLLNIFVLALQTKGTGFLIKSSWLAANSYYEDHCAGLFGFNGTNVLGLFSIFVMMANLSYSQINKGYRKKIIIFTFLMQGVMAFLSQYNDNIGFYLLIIIFLAVYFCAIIEQDWNISRRILNILKYLIILFVLFVIAYNMPVLGSYIERTVVDRIQRLLFYDAFGGPSGSSERLAIIRYALELESTYYFGTGVGSTQWIQANTYGFPHFGINSLGSYILIAGIWFSIIYTLLYAEIYYSLVPTRAKQSFLIKIAVIGVVVIFSIYTTVYNDARTALLVGLIIAILKPIINAKTMNNKSILKRL